MINWTDGDKPPDRLSGTLHPQKQTPSSWWTMWYTREQVEAAIKAKQERRSQFTGSRKIK